MYVYPASCIYTCYVTSMSITTTSITVAFGGQLGLFRRRLVPRSLGSPWLELHNYEDDRPKSTDVVKPLEGELNKDDVLVKMDGNREKRSVQEEMQDDRLNTTGDFT